MTEWLMTWCGAVWRMALEIAAQQWRQHPLHLCIEAAFVALMVYFYITPLHKVNKPIGLERPTAREAEELLRSFVSEPFRDQTDAVRDSTFPFHSDGGVEVAQVHSRRGLSIVVSLVVKGSEGPHDDGSCFSGNETHERSTEVLRLKDVSTLDMLGMGTHPKVLDVAKVAVRRYGVGSCGPRGFYGSLVPHLDAEAELAKFIGTESALVVSYSFATVSTILPCHSSRGDVLLCDEGCCLPIQHGCTLSRSNVFYYRHLDLQQLEEQMQTSWSHNVRKSTRRAVVTEGLFLYSGDVCPLPQILALCEKYGFRLYLDDSVGFGVLGKCGRGTPEHFNLPIRKIDLYFGSLGTSLGAVGGFCAASTEVIEFQRMAATGYCYSAALPPYTTSATIAALRLLDRDNSFVTALRRNAQYFRLKMRERLTAHPLPMFKMLECADDVSPIVVLQTHRLSTPELQHQLHQMVRRVAQRGFLIHRSVSTREERSPVKPSLRVVLKAAMSLGHLDELVTALVEALES